MAIQRSARHSLESTNLADLLERVLDKGIVIAGDIRINLVDVELLTIQIRLVICSVDKAKEMGKDASSFKKALGEQPRFLFPCQEPAGHPGGDGQARGTPRPDRNLPGFRNEQRQCIKNPGQGRIMSLILEPRFSVNKTLP